jgi:hypothetical protein
MTTEIFSSVEERNETIQDVIDRLLYLPEEQLREYKQYLDRLSQVYSVNMEVRNGIRIYHVTNQSK